MFFGENLADCCKWHAEAQLRKEILTGSCDSTLARQRVTTCPAFVTHWRVHRGSRYDLTDRYTDTGSPIRAEWPSGWSSRSGIPPIRDAVACQRQIVDVPSRSGPVEITRLMSITPAYHQPCRTGVLCEGTIMQQHKLFEFVLGTFAELANLHTAAAAAVERAWSVLDKQGIQPPVLLCAEQAPDDDIPF